VRYLPGLIICGLGLVTVCIGRVSSMSEDIIDVGLIVLILGVFKLMRS
jgi:hypothetical protein